MLGGGEYAFTLIDALFTVLMFFGFARFRVGNHFETSKWENSTTLAVAAVK